MTMAAPPRASLTGKQRLPDGYAWSRIWRLPDGTFTEGDREMPVDRNWNLSGELWLCPTDDCTTGEWVFGQAPERPCCPQHPYKLVPVATNPDDSNPVSGARERLYARVREVIAAQRQRAMDAATARLAAAQDAVTEATRRTAHDMRGHVPSLAITGTVAAADIAFAATSHPLLVAAVGAAVSTFGVGLAYLATYAAERLRAHRAGVEFLHSGRVGRRARARARQIATAVFTGGVWTVALSILGVDPATYTGLGGLGLGLLLGWAANRTHWDDLWAARRRLAAMARAKAEEAARLAAEEAERAARGPAAEPQTAPVDDSDSPEAMGRWLAAEWERISHDRNVPPGLQMDRTRIVPEATKEVTAPINGEATRIGHEFLVESDPGVLVPRGGSVPPLVAAREWLAAMLGRDPSTVSIVDRPDSQPNRALLLITDQAPLGGTVTWKGREGVRRTADGVILVHVGRSLTGEDVFEAAYTPGQPGGGLTVGTTGGGKSAGTILKLLNALVAGIFSVLYDPKQLVDYADFVGVIPIGVSREHRNVIRQSLNAEMRRRQQHLTTRPRRDRFGRRRAGETVWDPQRDGPPILSVWDEFHMEASDQAFVAGMTEMVRLQRVTAMMIDVITQGGGLADLNDSVFRGLLSSTSLRLYRMPLNLARLAGYKGTFDPEDLPRLPGMSLVINGESNTEIMRSAYVPRDDVDGSVFDHLYAPDMTPLLTPPTLPKETIEVFEREGLMDLWRLGQGPNGMTNLLGNTHSTPPPTPASASAAAPAATDTMQAADVVLAIIWANPGCPRATIDNHPAWQVAPGWTGKPPVPSTISRAVQQLRKAELVEQSEYRITAKGEDQAKAADALLATSGAEQHGRRRATENARIAAAENQDPTSVTAQLSTPAV